MQRLFVYGSLMREELHHAQLEGACFVGLSRTSVGFQLLDLGAYPGMLARGGGHVLGELYDVPDSLLAALDAFEEHPSVYLRTQLRLEDGQLCQTYLLCPEHAHGAPVLEHGNWRLRGRAGP